MVVENISNDILRAFEFINPLQENNSPNKPPTFVKRLPSTSADMRLVNYELDVQTRKKIFLNIVKHRLDTNKKLSVSEPTKNVMKTFKRIGKTHICTLSMPTCIK